MRRLQIVALGLELLDVRERIGVLLLGQRVDGAELLAAPSEPFQATGQLLTTLLLGQRLGGGQGLELQLGRERRQCLLGVGRLVA